MENQTLYREFTSVYTKFKLHFYKKVLSRFQTREATLTTSESFSMEIIHALNRPTVNEFASFTGISLPNAAYKIDNLIQKGYVIKEQSTEDKRKYHLIPTEKYFNYYNISQAYVQAVVSRIDERIPPEDIHTFCNVLRIISSELMPEVTPNFTKADE